VGDTSQATLSARRARIAERREEWRERDSARYRLAEELADDAGPSIPQEAGFVLLPPGELDGADAVVAAANELIEHIGHDELLTRNMKDGYIAREFLPPEALRLDSPYMQFALSPEILAPISAYLGLVPVLNNFDVWYSVHAAESPKSSQRWHLDSADTTQIKVWIHCSDVGPDSGPLTVLDAATSDDFADRIGYDFREGHRVPDAHVDELAASAVTALEGPAGTVHFVDTSRCFHFGSRVAQGGIPRRVFVAQYLTPYAFRFKSSHLERAPFRELADESSSELERLVLGLA
jgi:hypothetical protein